MLNSYINSFLYTNNETFNGTILVTHQRKTTYKKSFGKANYDWDIPNTSTTKFRIGSVTKIFTAVAILMLIEENKLQFDDTINRFIPVFPKGNLITIDHLLTHTSGVGNITSQQDFLLKSCESRTPDELINWIITCPFESNPGETFNYSNSGYIVLGKIIEVISGISYEEFLKLKILQPLSMMNTGLDSNSTIQKYKANGYELHPTNHLQPASFINMSNSYSAGGLFSTVEDLHLLDLAIKENRLLSSDITSRMFTAGSYEYGYGWNISMTTQNNKLVFHHGGINGFTSSYLRLIEKDVTIIILSNVSTILTSTLANEIASYTETNY
ncbi:serine hydrolase domain-containing protein [Bacillus gaemokensis]|uniref:Beta-lactamase n=1 Tax=Bacillus gaemokensis TaxID=574375 RepID=A0A073K8X6_9BACI|nr:serine hydrolase domain-containing protein [Bacillus gaemokensis]KEK22956.1 beta-lactamase [Bacillus gaemokensis]KYG37488.1 serine hydrolase [Bacillus gaemokensis]